MADPQTSSSFLQGKNNPIPLSLRFAHLFIKEAQPSMRDAFVAGVVLLFAFASKVASRQLAWSLSLSNLLEAQFPIVAAAMAFFVVHVFKTAGSLVHEVRAESGETEYDLYPSLVLPERIKAKKQNETPPYFRFKIFSLAAIFTFAFCAIGLLSWKANAFVSVLSEQHNMNNSGETPTPAPVTSEATTAPQASATTSPLSGTSPRLSRIPSKAAPSPDTMRRASESVASPSPSSSPRDVLDIDNLMASMPRTLRCHVFIVDSAHRPKILDGSDVKVIARSILTGREYSAKTDFLGNANLTLPQGTYTVIAERKGYRQEEKEIVSIASENKDTYITLEQIPSLTPP